MESTNLPSNNSNQQLMDDDSDGLETRAPSINSESPKSFRTVTKTQWITVAVLCYVNLINYMDRFTMAGIMKDIQDHFHITDDKGGLLQTVFVVSYMVFAPIFGYLGDRYSRKRIMAFGVFLWSLTTLLGSFMDTYPSFIALRALVGIGEASYSTIAPTIISDLFVKDLRAKMLALFYFAIPVGSGLGYIVGSETAKAAGSWQWALRVTPIMGAIAVLLIFIAVKDPKRGESEGRSHLVATSWGQDLSLLVKNKSFMLSTLGFMCVAFVTGALAWWGPTFIHRGIILQPGSENVTLDEVSFTFGVMTMLAGLLGVPLGSFLSQFLRSKIHQADPLICGIGLFLSTPLFIGAMLLAESNQLTCYILIFFGQLALNLNWAIVADILLYVVIPTRRSTAEAFQILISHLFGDAGSPYFVGLLADFIFKKFNASNTDNEKSYYSLQYALFTTSFVEVLGGVFFLFTALYIVRDKKAAEREIRAGETTIGEKLLSNNGEIIKLAAEIHLLTDEKKYPYKIGETNEHPTHIFADEPGHLPPIG